MKLIIAEKPSVAKEIAKVVGSNNREKGFFSGSGYLVSWCYGHLIELAQPHQYDGSLEKWTLDTLPILPKEFKTTISENTASQFEVLKELMNSNDVDLIIEATDAGREGELIFRLVYAKAKCKKPFKRLWISSMEEKAIVDGLNSMKDGREYDNLYDAARSRQRADWLVGINFTRLYTKLYGKILKVGRVQTPTLNLIVQRELSRKNFIPSTYFNLNADLGDFSATRREDEPERAKELTERCKGAFANVKSVEKKINTDYPDALYDLTALQREANRFLGYSAKQTLDVLQNLYEQKLATYPRTDSRYITSDMSLSTQQLIVHLLSCGLFNSDIISEYDVSITSIDRIVKDAKVTDHHAILPTEHITSDILCNLPTAEKSILTLIIFKLLTAVYTPRKYESVKAVIDINAVEFTANGTSIIDRGYTVFESFAKDLIRSDDTKSQSENNDNILPPLTQGEVFTVLDVKKEEKKTKPKPSYTEDTLLKAMETAGKEIENAELQQAMKGHGLGTPATRAGIIENIIKSGYVIREKKKLLPTDTGFTFIGLISDKVKSPELTAEWEHQLAEIQDGSLCESEFMSRISRFISDFVFETKNTASAGISSVFSSENETVGTCPKCGANVFERNKGYFCSKGRDACGFVLWKKIAGREITGAQAVKLLTSKKTGLIKGFTAKSGSSFDAFLVLKPDYTIGFEFEKQGGKK